MAHHKSALKRIKTAEQARIVNRKYRKIWKDSVKEVLASESRDDAAKKMNTAVSNIDKLVIKGILNKNKAAREKSKLARHVNNLA